MKKVLSFDDVLIVPNFSTVKSRADVNTSTTIGSSKYVVPIMSANMDTITDSTMANAMKLCGAAAAIHRFMSVEESVRAYKTAPSAWMSIGLGPEEEKRFSALKDAGCTKFLLDVAHAANQNVVDLVRKLCLEDIELIIGNFSGAYEIDEFLTRLSDGKETIPHQIKAVKLGVGSGSMCTTRIVTGCGVPTLASVLDVAYTSTIKDRGIAIIADGGIKNSGDIAKALAAGADMVMIGSLLSGTKETPGEVMNYGPGNNFMKSYRGSASLESYQVQGKVADHRTPEGESTLVPYKGPAESIIYFLVAGVRSAFSYVGAHDLVEFQNKATLVEISSSGHTESRAHGKK